MWSVLFENKKVKEFETRREVDEFLSSLGSVIREYYSISVDTGNADVDRMLVEGLVKGDLERIVLPRLSVDEYVPADPETDNIVLAFYVKGVPEAVLPFKNFAEKSRGVLSTDFGDSETILNASIVYVEYDRENIDIKHIDELMNGVARLCNIKPNEFTITFPHTNEKFPYKPELIKEYFDSEIKELSENLQKIEGDINNLTNSIEGNIDDITQLSKPVSDPLENLIAEIKLEVNPEEEWVIQYGGKLVATLPKTEPKYERSKYRNKTPPSTREIKEVLNYLQDSI